MYQHPPILPSVWSICHNSLPVAYAHVSLHLLPIPGGGGDRRGLCTSPSLARGNFDGNNTEVYSDKGGVFIEGKVGHGFKNCGNNTCCCSDKGVAL